MSDARTQEHEAAAEKLAREIVRALVFVPDRKDGEPRVVLPPITALIAAALAGAVRVAREEDAKVLAHEAVANYDIDSPGYLALVRLAGVLRSRVGDAAATAKPACCIHPARVDGPCPCECHVAARYRKGDATPGPDHAFIAYRGHVDLYDDPRCRTCGVNRSKHATPGPESFRPAPCFARAVDIVQCSGTWRGHAPQEGNWEMSADSIYGIVAIGLVVAAAIKLPVPTESMWDRPAPKPQPPPSEER